MADIDRIKKALREDEMPYFEESDYEFYLSENQGDVNATIYNMLIVKSESSTIQVSGLNTQDTSTYFKRLAQKYRKFNSGLLQV